MHHENAQPYLQIRNLTKKFGEFIALKDISIDIIENEFVCFLGPSGCGKTTLLRVIAGLDIQTYGSIIQAGKDISSLPPSERDFGIVFQSYALFPNLTITRNVAVGLENVGMPAPKVQHRVDELLELVGLVDQKDKYPAQLSGGQQQRVALARAMAISPGLLLLDEPLSALDAKVRSRLRHEIKELQRKFAVTTIMVTHDQEEALTMADRIVVMDNGIIEQVGKPEEIYRSPKTKFVADFVGTMNFLSGTIVSNGTAKVGDVVLTCDTEDLPVGSSVMVAIRPEEINARNITNSDSNIVQIEVLHIEFLGSFCRVKLGGGDLKDVSLRADFSISLTRLLSIKVGLKLKVSLPSKFICIYLTD
jgi:iron(III) transport system ATP-binding protein